MADLQQDPGPTQFESGIGYFGAFQVGSSANGLTASTTHTVAGATKLTAMFNTFSTVANVGDAALLPASFPGMSIAVVNNGANAVQVYGTGSDTINGIAGSTGVAQMDHSTVFYQCTKAGFWTAQDLGCGTNGNFATTSYQNALVASTTQSAAGGTRISTSLAQFDTVAHNNDAATLPAAQPGMQITVINNGADTLQVFALTAVLGGQSGGDTINGSTSTTIATPPAITIFFATEVGTWITK
jgi:hypothetical protein